MESINFAANMCKYQFICTLEIWRALDVMENQHLILGCMDASFINMNLFAIMLHRVL